MTPIHNILSVLEVLPSPYIVLKCNAGNNHVIQGFNSAYAKHIDPDVRTGPLADALPFKEPLFAEKLYKLLSQSCEQESSMALFFKTIHSDYKIEITPVRGHEKNECIVLLNFIKQHETRSEPAHSGKYYYSFLDNLMEGCQIINHDWKYVYINAEAAKQGQYDQLYYIGKSIMELYPGVEHTEIYGNLYKCMHERIIQKTETEFTFNNGSKCWFDLHIYPHKDGIFILSLDITKRKKHEEELLRSEHKFRSMYEHSVDMIILLDPQLRVRYKSPSTQKHIGWEDKDLQQLYLSDLVHEDDRAALSAAHLLVTETPAKPVPVTVRLKHKNGQYIWFEGFATGFLHDEAIEGIVLSMRDITERRHTEITLKESDDKFKTLFNSSPLPQWLYDTETLRFIDVNEAAIKSYGFSHSEFLSMTLTDIRPKEEVENFMNMRKKMLASEEGNTAYNPHLYFIHQKKDGSRIHVDIKASSVWVNGKSARLIIARDVTAELAFEKQLLESNERYHLVLEATNESVIDWDIVNDTTIWGKGFENNFGYDLSRYDNHLWSNNIYSEDRSRVLADLQETLEDRQKKYFEAAFRYIKANGDLAYVQHRGIILRDRNGKAVRAIGAMIDVTELNEKIAEVEYQNEMLRDIAWTQSHVVRAPLARIMGLINLLENDNFSVNSTYNLSEILSYIVHSAYELNDIIKDIVKKSEKYNKHEFKSPDHR
jgi:PAS domain S-box-containing protein